MTVYGKLDIPEDEVRRMSDDAIVARLVASGTTRLTAYRLVELERTKAEPSRARPHMQARGR